VSTADLTTVFCHFGKDKFNHRLRFGVPQALVKLDSYRSIACFKPGQIFGYIRWRADKYGTQDWQFHILKAQSAGPITSICGVKPGAKSLCSIFGAARVKRSLKHIDALELKTESGLESLPQSYWVVMKLALSTANPLRDPPFAYSLQGDQYVG